MDAIEELDSTRCLLEWKPPRARYPEEPAGLLALDPQLVCYSWVTGIADVAQVVFVRKRLVEIQIVVKISVIGRSHNAFPEDLVYPTREEVPPVDPAHYLELEKLLEFVFRIGERLCSRNTRSKTFPSAFVAGLRRLTDALLKQQRLLRETTPAPSAVRTEIRDYTGVSQKRATILEERRERVSRVESHFKQNETGGNDEE